MSAGDLFAERIGAELTLRGVALGALITLVFTAANVYFGLKAGLTFATSIPAAVISMALLRGFRGVTVQENNVVQTIASAAGTLSAIIFVLPGLVMIGWWTGFPYAVAFTICAVGGVLGVMYSIPLRRALVTNSDLPYPEGVACAEVLKVGAAGGAAGGAAAGIVSRRGLATIVWGAVVSGLYTVATATQLLATDFLRYFRVGDRGAVTGYDLSLSFGLLAVGHLVGLWVGIAILVGVLIAWGGMVPWLAMQHLDPGPAGDLAVSIWRHQVRFVGAGVLGTAAVWTLLTLLRPVFAGFAQAMAASRLRRSGRGGEIRRVDRDIPIGMVALVTAGCMLPIGVMLAGICAASGLGDYVVLLVAGGVVFILLMSFFVASVCGYMAGLIGASNSPLSGVGIIVVLSAALLLAVVIKPLLPAAAGPALVAYALFVTSVVFCAATISNDNLQDLKTGQLVGATPWRQQVGLLIGVVAGATVIPPVLDLLNRAYGFTGAPGAGAHALAAPQASLISTLARGVIQGDLDWRLLGAGAALGVVLIAFDEVLKRHTRAQLPPLAIGLGIYLPMATNLTIVVGAVAGWWYERRAARTRDPDGAKQLGVLLASGLIVGESLVGVLLAAVVVFSGKDAPLALVGDSFADAAVWLGVATFATAGVALYAWLNRLAGPAENGAL